MVLKEAEEGSGGKDPVALGMMAVMKQRGLAESLTHFRFEDGFCLLCDWRRINLNASAEVPMLNSRCFLISEAGLLSLKEPLKLQ